jgi:putative endonuclease
MRNRAAAERRGVRAERRCAWLLRLKGWRILARRYRTPVGEIDLIARRGRLLALIEVKARPSEPEALGALSRTQRQRIARAAAVFLSRQPDSSTLSPRFDVMLVRPWRLPRHLADAWRPDDS